MRVVLDTNLVISGLFWGGNPRQILNMAVAGKITLCTSQALLDELLDVLSRPKFADRLTTVIRATPQEVVDDYTALTEVVEVQSIEPIVADDPDDDHVVACAVVAEASYIISGDRHLLDLGTHGNILVVSATQFMALLIADDR